MTSEDVSAEIVPESAMPADLDQAIRALLCRCFPNDAETFHHTRAWHSSAPEFSLILRDPSASPPELAAHLGIVRREIRCGNTRVLVAGVQNLCVAARYRGRRLGAQLLGDGMSEARRRGIDFGLLFCVPELETYYGRQGWTKVSTPIMMRDEQGRPVPLPSKNIGMSICLAGRGFPPGKIDLAGPDW